MESVSSNSFFYILIFKINFGITFILILLHIILQKSNIANRFWILFVSVKVLQSAFTLYFF